MLAIKNLSWGSIIVLLEIATQGKSLDEVKVPLWFLPKVKQNKS